MGIKESALKYFPVTAKNKNPSLQRGLFISPVAWLTL
ncbi:hypothetical protein VP120E341_P0057 [Vibrio phage 120E34-1]|nr:hypothetical protein VP120E341_P0057 [Vibrio phage 120E34-1]